MKTLVSRFQDNLHKRAVYRRTISQLSNLPLAAQLDLGIYSGDIRRIARQAVYGA